MFLLSWVVTSKTSLTTLCVLSIVPTIIIINCGKMVSQHNTQQSAVINQYSYYSKILFIIFLFILRCYQSIFLLFTYGKLASGAESPYEICCSFPQNVRTLHALESSIFIRFLFRLLRSSDLEFCTTLS